MMTRVKGVAAVSGFETEEAIFRATEGPFTKAFHRIWARPNLRAKDRRFYPPVIAQLHRAVRMLDTAEPWELISLGSAPLLFAFIGAFRWLGLGLVAQGYGLILLVCYAGFYFTLWVFLDRRLDELDKMRVFSLRRKRVDDRDSRLMRRRTAKNDRAINDAKLAEARQRGQAKAEHGAPHETAPRTTTVPLDDLLDPD